MNPIAPTTPPPGQQCPLCGQPNQCAVAAGQDAASCWCMQARISPLALARLPAAERGQRCICARCGAETTPPTPG